MTEQELRKKYNPEGSSLRQAQLRMLEMLCFIDQICIENDIEYWIDYGTLLGAVRHGGFIPWDDDVDISMTRENLQKFRRVMSQNISNDYILQNHQTDSGYFRCWDVLRDLHSEYIHEPELPTERYLKYRGLQVDIFPFEDTVYYSLHRLCSKYLNFFVTYPLMGKKYFSVLRPLVRFHYNFLQKIIVPFLRFIGKNRAHCYYMMSYGNIFPDKEYKRHLYPLQRIRFEGHEFFAPHDLDSFLTSLYGDWRKIPEENNIKTHCVKFSFKK